MTTAVWCAQAQPVPQEETSLPPSEQDARVLVTLWEEVANKEKRIEVYQGLECANGQRTLQIVIPGEEGLQTREVLVTGGTTFHEAHSSDLSVIVIATELQVGEEQVFACDRGRKVLILTGLPKECPIRRVCLSPDNRHYALITDRPTQVLGVVGAHRKGEQKVKESNMVIAERGVWMPEELQKDVALEKDVEFAANDRAVLVAYQPRGKDQQKKLFEYLKVVECAVIKAGVVGAKLIPIIGEAQDTDFWEKGEHRITEAFRENRQLNFVARKFICTADNLFFLECSDSKGVIYQYNFEQKTYKIRDSGASELPIKDIAEWDKEPFVKPEINVLSSPAESPRQVSAFFPSQPPSKKSFLRTHKGYVAVGVLAAVGIAWGIYRYGTGAWRNLLPTFYRPRSLTVI